MGKSTSSQIVCVRRNSWYDEGERSSSCREACEGNARRGIPGARQRVADLAAEKPAHGLARRHKRDGAQAAFRRQRPLSRHGACGLDPAPWPPGIPKVPRGSAANNGTMRQLSPCDT